MRLSETLFRWRRWVLFLIFLLGFWAPLDRMGGVHPGTTWLFLAGALARYRVLSIAYASITVMAVAILFALLAALLRTWGAAYLGMGVVLDRALHGEQVVADGPFRYVRNPLYLGLWLHSFALAILMPPGGALFTIVAITLLVVVLVHAEEQSLAATSGEAYFSYMRRVPRFIPSLFPRVPSGEQHARWGQAFLGEIYMWGVAVGYAVFARRYNVTLLEQCVLISLGVSIVLRGILRPAAPQPR